MTDSLRRLQARYGCVSHEPSPFTSMEQIRDFVNKGEHRGLKEFRRLFPELSDDEVCQAIFAYYRVKEKQL